ncbi:MAG TPA: gluconate 2-dehydrogenase subunit 3 family protein [Acidimicrobiales bacterium]|nr:gluconate 2-dehydrogenase subunit 3 family protein [Acidimicrobiales bacterium]
MLTRRQFVKAAVLAGATVAVPPGLESLLSSARALSGTSRVRYYLADDTRWNTCAALCARIVPTGADPVDDPGATEAQAVVFIDRFLAAFALPTSVADQPPIWVKGRWSGRNPFPKEDGTAGSRYPPDEFLSDSGQGHFLPLTAAQLLSWRSQVEGDPALDTLPAGASATWAGQVKSGLIPSPAPAIGLQKTYDAGLAAFDGWSKCTFGVPFALASPQEQDLLLALAGNVVLGAVTSNVPLPSPPAPPPAATALFPIVTLHTFQATYGIPEYAWRNQDDDPTVIRLEGTAQWRAIGFDGDTQPLGNSLFDPDLYGPGAGPNSGFGAAPGSAEAADGVFVPFGGYREYRPVSTLDGSGVVLTESDLAPIKEAMSKRRG